MWVPDQPRGDQRPEPAFETQRRVLARAALPFKRGGHRGQMQRVQVLNRGVSQALTAYLWLAFSCQYGNAGPSSTESLLEPVPGRRDTPLLRFETAICLEVQTSELEQLLHQDSRFREVDYVLGLSALQLPQIDFAIARLTRAYEWHPRWPPATLALANLYFDTEDFEHAIEFFDRTLMIIADHCQALLGRAGPVPLFDPVSRLKTKTFLDWYWRQGRAFAHVTLALAVQALRAVDVLCDNAPRPSGYGYLRLLAQETMGVSAY